jgi:hypothetical protein
MNFSKEHWYNCFLIQALDLEDCMLHSNKEDLVLIVQWP